MSETKQLFTHRCLHLFVFNFIFILYFIYNFILFFYFNMVKHMIGFLLLLGAGKTKQNLFTPLKPVEGVWEP